MATDGKEPVRTSGLAVASFILSILPTCAGQLVAIALGIAALVSIDKDREHVKGGGFAMAGLFLSVMWLIAGLATAVVVGIMLTTEGHGQAGPGGGTQPPAPAVGGGEENIQPPSSPGRTPASRRKVVLKVEADSWVQKGPYNIAAAVGKRLGEAGVKVVQPESPDPDGIVLVEYAEEQGREYASMFGFGGSIGSGTSVGCTVTVLEAATAEVVCRFEIRGNTPSQVSSSGGLHEEAIKAFEQQQGFRLLGFLVAAALKDEAAMPALAPLLEDGATRDTVLAIVKNAGYEPKSPVERAAYAVAGGDLDECESIGPPAAGALVKHLEGMDHSQCDGVLRVVQVLAAVDPASARARAAELLEQYSSGNWYVSDDDEKDKVMVGLLEILGKVGDKSSLGAVAKHRGDERSAVADAAKSADSSIRARLGTR